MSTSAPRLTSHLSFFGSTTGRLVSKRKRLLILPSFSVSIQPALGWLSLVCGTSKLDGQRFLSILTLVPAFHLGVSVLSVRFLHANRPTIPRRSRLMSPQHPAPDMEKVGPLLQKVSPLPVPPFLLDDKVSRSLAEGLPLDPTTVRPAGQYSYCLSRRLC